MIRMTKNIVSRGELATQRQKYVDSVTIGHAENLLRLKQKQYVNLLKDQQNRNVKIGRDPVDGWTLLLNQTKFIINTQIVTRRRGKMQEGGGGILIASYSENLYFYFK